MHVILNHLNVARKTLQFYSLWVFSNNKKLYYIFNPHFWLYDKLSSMQCNAMHDRGHGLEFFCCFFLIFSLLIIFYFVCMFCCLYPFVWLFILFYPIFCLKIKEKVFKRSALYVLEYHVSYNERVLTERKSEQVHKPHASLFLDNAIYIAW